MIFDKFPCEVTVNAPFEIVFRTERSIDKLKATYKIENDAVENFPEDSVDWDNHRQGARIKYVIQRAGALRRPLRVTFRFKVTSKDGTVETFQFPADIVPEATTAEKPVDPPRGDPGPVLAPTHFAALVPPIAEFRPKDRRWASIFKMSQSVSYASYATFIEQVLGDCVGRRDICNDLDPLCAADEKAIKDIGRFYGTYSYEDLKQATELFLLCRAHHRCTEPREELEPRLKYSAFDLANFKAALDTTAKESLLTKAYAFLASRDEPAPFHREMGLKLRCTDDMFLEYIWTFYHDIGMLEQTLKAISLRFQNKRSSLLKNQLEELEISHLRPITDLLWGYINDEQHRLSVMRRTVEYQHQYGLTVTGKATLGVESIDRRSEFLSAFHNLLLRAHVFFIENANLTVRADPFPVQNALKDLHKILFDGAHNQFSRATFSSRAEFLIGQWLLARPEIRLFLHGREMTPYKEPWMAPVDAMRRLQGWGEDSVASYRDLAVLGERLLLSIRYGDWNEDNITDVDVRNWALSYKEDIQLYCHAYRAVTGVDLTVVDKLNAKQNTSQPVHLIEARTKTLRAAG